MIKSLSIRNYQSHEKTDLEFHEGVNIIIGPSDSGKTAIIRALRFLIYNRPNGNSMRSNWGGDTSVSICTDKDWISRKKGKEEQYLLNSSVFTAFKSEIPQEIIEALNMTDINIQRQLDDPFLLGESYSPGDVAKHFNKVANLDKIDLATQNIGSWIKNLTQTLNFRKEELEKNQESLKEFEYLDTFEIELEVLEQKQTLWTSRITYSNSLLKLTNNIALVNTQINQYDVLLDCEHLLNDVLKKIDKRSTMISNRRKLLSTISNVNDIQSDIDNQKNLLVFEDQVTNLLDQHEKIYELTKKKDRLKNLLSEISQVESHILSKKYDLKEKHKLYDENMGDVCIFCGSKIKQ